MTIPDAPPLPEVPLPDEPDIGYPNDEPLPEYPETEEPVRLPPEPQEHES
jgi:hypothetical protein